MADRKRIEGTAGILPAEGSPQRRGVANRPPILLLIASGFLLTLSVSCTKPLDLPKLYPVPNTSLVNERGEAVHLDAMKGSVTVYNFIFTHCTGTCPIMTNNMRALTPLIDKDEPVRFVSVSVDPARDTPAVLSQYAARVRSDPRWTFLTGERAAIVDLSVKGFKLTAGDPMPGGEPLLHDSRFAVADKQGVIRGYYNATDGKVAEEVARVVEQLLNE